MVEDADRLAGVIELLRMSHGRDVVDGWRLMAQDGRFGELADGLMELHYDPRYDKHRERMAMPFAEIAAGALGPQDMDGLTAAVAEAVGRLAGR